eukprot:1672862-Amphidinium_carterae.3
MAATLTNDVRDGFNLLAQHAAGADLEAGPLEVGPNVEPLELTVPSLLNCSQHVATVEGSGCMGQCSRGLKGHEIYRCSFTCQR